MEHPINLMAGQYVLVSTLPKSGTYLVARILEELGLYNTFWHVGINRTMLSNVPDGKLLDFALPHDLANEIIRYVDVNVNSIMKLLRPREFCVGHLPPHVLDPIVLQRTSVIFVYRNLRDILTSTFLYYERLLPEEKVFSKFLNEEDRQRKFFAYLSHIISDTIELWCNMLGWLHQRNAISLSYEDICKSNDNKIAIALRCHLMLDCEIDEIRKAIERALSTPTITLNGVSAEDRQAIWTIECENLFIQFGGLKLQETFDQISLL